MKQIPESATATPRPALGGARAVTLLILIILLVELVPLAYTFVMPALTEIGTHFRTPSVAWSVTLLTLSGAVFTPLVGKLGDLYGKKRWMLIAAAIFVIGCLMCALAPNFALFLIGRVLQGAGLAILVLVYGLIRDLMPKNLVSVGLGLVATGMGGSAVLGPFLGGYLIDTFGYTGIFWFMGIYVLIFGVVLAIALPETPVRVHATLGVIGLVLLAAGSSLVILGIGWGGTDGFSAPKTWAAIIAGIVLLAAWAWHERATAAPLIDPALLKSRPILLTFAGSFVLQFVFGSQPMVITLYAMMKPEAGLGYGFGLSALGVSQITVGSGIAGMIAGPLAGRACRSIHPGYLLGVAGLAIAVSSVMFVGAHGSIAAVAASATVFGIAVGAGSAALPNLLVRHVPAESQGIAGGAMNEFGTIGSALGTQVMILILSLPGVVGLGGAAGYHAEGFVYVFWALAAVGLLVIAIGALLRSPLLTRRPLSAQGAEVGSAAT